jgi:1,4-alpha-glucan branching enzyme
MWAHPGNDLLFMGGELAQEKEWHHDRSLDWHLLDDAAHAGVARCVADLNRIHRAERALHELDFDPAGFEWADHRDAEHSIIAILRHAPGAPSVLCVLNLTPVVRRDYRLGVPSPGRWTELLNTDALDYGGSGVGNAGAVDAEEHPSHALRSSLRLVLPPLGAVFLRAPS